MKKHFINVRIIALHLIFAACLLIVGCSKKKDAVPDNTNTGGGTTKIDSTAVTTGTPEGSVEVGADPDDVYDATAFTTPVGIAFSGTTATITPATTKGVTITQTNGDVVITSTAKSVAYTISGTTANGSVKVYSDNKYSLTLNGANITNLDGPAINLQSSKRMFLILADGTTNTLADGPVYATSTEDQKGTFFAEGQVIFTGKGSLTVAGNYKHGICSDDYIRISSGNITVTNSVSDGIHTNDQFIMDGGTLKITAGSDGIETEEGNMIFNDGNINITSTTGDGIKASYEGTDVTIIPYININGGTINVSAPSDEGISSKNALTINKGNIAVNSSDDAFSAATAININGGYIYAFSKANDAMDSNGTFTLTGGKVVAIGSPAPESGIDCGTNVLKITGGQLVAIGGTTSSPSATASTVNSVILGSGTAQIIHIEAADATEALTFESPIAYGTLVYASAKLKDNTSYNIYTGGSVASGTSIKGLFTSGTYTRGPKSATTFTTSSRVTKVGGTVSTN